MNIDLARYRKGLTAVTTAVLGWAGFVIASPPTHITAGEWLAGGIALAGALGVYAIPNTPPPARKAAKKG